jgi:hypothetical protein
VSVKKHIQTVIAQLLIEIEERAKRKGRPPVKPEPAPAATAAQIKAYEKHLKLALPASYRAFLELHDGYQRLACPGDMLSTRSVMPRGAWFSRVRDWKQTSARADLTEVADAIPIANLDSASSWAYLDPHDVSAKHELRIVRWLNGDTDRYDDLIELFEGRIRLCRLDLRRPAKRR